MLHPLATTRHQIAEHWISFSIFLLPALSVIAPSGYSFGAVALLLGSTYIAYRRISLIDAWGALPRMVQAIVLLMLLYAAVWILDAALRGEGVREFDRPSRFIFAALCLLILSQIRISAEWFWAGVIVGSAGAGLHAGWEVFVLGSSRASGTAQTIQFGNISMLLGLMSCAGIVATWTSRARWAWRPAFAVAAVLGVSGSFLSGTRGAWLMPLILLVFSYQLFDRWKPRMAYTAVCVIALTLVYAAAYYSPSTGMGGRIDSAVEELTAYVNGDERGGSVGYRLEMWQGAFTLFTERPLVGWGENGYIDGLRQLGNQGKIEKGASRFTHAHNDWANVFAKKGILGALILAAIYFLPLLFFIGRSKGIPTPPYGSTLSAGHYRAVGLSSAGIILVTGFFLAGMTQVSFNHNSGVMIYAFFLAVLIGLICEPHDRSPA